MQPPEAPIVGKDPRFDGCDIFKCGLTKKSEPSKNDLGQLLLGSIVELIPVGQVIASSQPSLNCALAHHLVGTVNRDIGPIGQRLHLDLLRFVILVCPQGKQISQFGFEIVLLQFGNLNQILFIAQVPAFVIACHGVRLRADILIACR